MSAEYNDKDVSSVLDKLEDIKEYRWGDSSEKIIGLCFSESEFDAYCFSEAVRSAIDSARYGRLHWIDSQIVSYYSMIHKNVSKKILDNTKNKTVVDGYVRSMAFNPLRDYDKLLDSPNADVRVIAAQYCSMEQLLSRKNDRSKKVRKVVYSRLGPVGHLDDMLSDRCAQIRSLGVSLAPFGYKKLSSMTNEIARDVFNLLIDKISKEDLPMLLANRNLKDRWVAKRFESRMNSGF